MIVTVNLSAYLCLTVVLLEIVGIEEHAFLQRHSSKYRDCCNATLGNTRETKIVTGPLVFKALPGSAWVIEPAAVEVRSPF